MALVGATELGGEEELVTSMSSPYVELLTGDPTIKSTLEDDFLT